MKEITIKDAIIHLRCDFFMCPNTAEKEIAAIDAAPGRCFRVCKEHFDAMVNKMAVVKEITVEKIVEVPVEKIVEKVVEKIVEKPVVKEKPIDEKPAEINKDNPFAGGK